MPPSDPTWLVGHINYGNAYVEVTVLKLERRVQIAFKIPTIPGPLPFNFKPEQAEEIAKMLQAGSDFFKT